jgi:chromosome segregation ATPase
MEAPAVPMKKARKNPYEGLTPEQIAEKKAEFVARMKEGKMRAKERRLAAAREPPNHHNDLAEAQEKFRELQGKLHYVADLMRKSDEQLNVVQERMNELEIIRGDLVREAHNLRNEHAAISEAITARDEHIRELQQVIAAEERENLALAAAGGGEP